MNETQTMDQADQQPDAEATIETQDTSQATAAPPKEEAPIVRRVRDLKNGKKGKGSRLSPEVLAQAQQHADAEAALAAAAPLTGPFEPEDRKERRLARCVNIARAMLETQALYDDAGLPGISTTTLRQEIRRALGLPVLSDEWHLGDLRAHSDAAGNHGLRLETQELGGRRLLLFNEANLEVCRALLAEIN